MNYFLITIVAVSCIVVTGIIAYTAAVLTLTKQKTNPHVLCIFNHRWANVSAINHQQKTNGILIRETTQVTQRCLHCNHMRNIRLPNIVLNLNQLNDANKHMGAALIPLNKANPSSPTPSQKKNILTLVPKPTTQDTHHE